MFGAISVPRGWWCIAEEGGRAHTSFQYMVYTPPSPRLGTVMANC